MTILKNSLSIDAFEQELLKLKSSIVSISLNTYFVFVNLPKKWMIQIWKTTAYIFGCVLLDATITLRDGNKKSYKVIYGTTHSLNTNFEYEFSQFREYFDDYIFDVKNIIGDANINFSLPMSLEIVKFKDIIIAIGLGNEQN